MPQVDLEVVVAVCRVSSSGRKIACEPLNDENQDVVENTPDSILLSKQAAFDWVYRNAFFERKESTKPTVSYRSNSSSCSQRVLKSKATLIGLPNTQKNNLFDMRKCKPTNVRLFPPKRSESIEKSRAQMKEPSSPKVSCIGRVRSKRCRRRQGSGHAKSEEKKKGFCANLLSFFRSDRRDRSSVKTEKLSVTSRKKNNQNNESVVINDVVMQVPGLGGLTRFASGRRSCEMDEGDGARLCIDLKQSIALSG
ncbi:hypothetical protein POM88_012575 [Heracleum sosnowskyi]|uniref:Uncharacterized protein n=1 Tax=Heracleum sosnowskyi TaxID=360622 RepID=A0AAD8IWR7_9APIA|nr:hypothetical protein POM88_012575 [Heracleum sosnowskyi]